MQKIYKSIITIFLLTIFPKILYCQGDIVFDQTHFELVTANRSAIGSYNNLINKDQKSAEDYHKKMTETYTEILIIRNIITESLTNINSALRNALSIKDAAKDLSNIYTQINEISEITSKHPIYLPLTKNYIHYCYLESLNVYSDIQRFALNTKEMVINYQERDNIIRDIRIRIRIIYGNLIQIKRILNKAINIGVFKSYTPFYQWLNQDISMMKNIINRSKFLFK